MSIKNSFRVIVAVATIGLICLAGFWVRSERSRILTEKKQQAAHHVEIAYSMLVQCHRLEEARQISREEAQGRVLTLLKDVRYDGDNYFWINDLHPRMIMHPIQPALDGKDLTDYRDQEGRRLFVEMVRAVKHGGSGYLEYTWGRPAGKDARPVPKLSFIKEFAPWGWIIGTGIYIGDVDAAWRHNAIRAAAVTVICVAVLLAISLAVFRSLFHHLNHVVDRMNRVALCRGDIVGSPDLRLPEPAADDNREVAVLVRGFNEMLQQIQRRDAELTKHREHLESLVRQRTAELSIANSRLEAAYRDIQLFLESIPSILIGLDQQGRVTRWNAAAARTFGVSAEMAIGRTVNDCGIKWLHTEMDAEISQWLSTQELQACDDLAYERDGLVRFVGISVRPVLTGQHQATGFLVTGADVTEKKCIEEQLRQAHKLEAIGQLAAGIAHEINTPTQYVTDNTRFVKDAWRSVEGLLTLCRRMRDEAANGGSISVASLSRFDEASSECEMGYLGAEVPAAIDQSLEGLTRVAKIIRAMREFAHPGGSEKQLTDINRAIASTIILSRGEWRHVAEVTTDFDESVPLVPCYVGEFNETILNLIVNAAHAVGEAVGGSREKGQIKITTRHDGEWATISVCDSGSGIPAEIRSRVFEPFFTTKPVGKGTGQGLALAHSMIVKKHHGQIWFETKAGQGTTFFVRLPVKPSLPLGPR
jgi:PAS domain S-box-containing protein